MASNRKPAPGGARVGEGRSSVSGGNQRAEGSANPVAVSGPRSGSGRPGVSTEGRPAGWSGTPNCGRKLRASFVARPESRRPHLGKHGPPRTRDDTTARLGGSPEPLLFQPRCHHEDASLEACGNESNRCAKPLTFIDHSPKSLPPQDLLMRHEPLGERRTGHASESLTSDCNLLCRSAGSGESSERGTFFLRNLCVVRARLVVEEQCFAPGSAAIKRSPCFLLFCRLGTRCGNACPPSRVKTQRGSAHMLS
jgi:hypothetical protein